MLVTILFDDIRTVLFHMDRVQIYIRVCNINKILLIELPVFIGMVHYRDGMLWGWLSPLRNEMFNSLVPYFQHQHGGEVDSNLKEEVELNMGEVDLNLMEVLLSCSFSFLRGKYEI